MSINEPAEPLSAFVGAFADAINEHDRLPPTRKRIGHAGYAAEVLVWCYWLAPFFEHRSGTPFRVWAAMTVVAALWLHAALWASRGQPQDFGVMLWALFFGGGAGWLLWIAAYPSDWGPFAVYLLQGFYWSVTAVSAARFAVAAQLLGGGTNAGPLMTGLLNNRNAPLLPARRRRWWPWKRS
jgi:hypothetical protein